MVVNDGADWKNELLLQITQFVIYDPYLVHSTCPLHAYYSYDWLGNLNSQFKKFVKDLSTESTVFVKKEMHISNLLPLFH